MNLIFKKKSYSFKLSNKLKNSKTTYLTKSGWIIKLTSNDKKIGFGEVSPLLEEDLKKWTSWFNDRVVTNQMNKGVFPNTLAQQKNRLNALKADKNNIQFEFEL